MPTYEVKSPDGKTYEVTAPEGASQNDVMNYVQSQHQAAAPAASTGTGLESFLRGAINGATFNLADPISAAADAALPAIGDMLDPKAPSHAASFGQRYNENLASLRQGLAGDQKAHPILSLAGNVAGGFANPLTRALPAPSSLGSAVAQGAGIGAAYGAGSAVSNQDSLGGAATDVGGGALTGGVMGAAAHGLGLLLKPAQKTAAAQMLNNEGVPTTIGQDLGGSPQRVEDSLTSMPGLDGPINNLHKTGIEEFNRAAYNRALAPLGVQYSQTGPVGNEGIQKVGELIGNAYDHAFTGAVVKNDAPFNAALSQAANDAANVLPPERLNLFTKNINRLVTGKFNQNGELTGDDLMAAKNWLAEQSRAAHNATIDEGNLASAYGDVLDALKTGIKTSDPQRGALLDAADKSYMQFMRVARAAGSNNASGKEGIFTPNQLGTAIRTLENSKNKMAFAKGLAPLQDLAQAGQQVLTPTVPDSGTAMRTMVRNPLAIPGVLAASAVGKTVYSGPGQAALKALAFGAPNARTAIAPLPLLLQPGALALIGSGATQPAP